MRYTVLLLAIICIALAVNVDLFAQDSLNVQQVGRIYNYWQGPADVFVQGDYAYIATGSSGLQILDVSDLDLIRVISQCEDNPKDARSVFIQDDYAYVIGGSGFLVIDISDPEHPDELSCSDIPGDEIMVEGNYAYVTAGRDGLKIIDISDPESPEIVSVCDIRCGYSFISNGYAYVISIEGIIVIDISDPESPEEVGSFELEYTSWCIFVSGNYAFIGRIDYLYIINIADPDNITEVSRCQVLGEVVFDVFVNGNYAYVMEGKFDGYSEIEFCGLQIIDLSDIENPHVVGSFRTGVQPNGVFIAGDYAYLTDDNWDGLRDYLRIVDVSNPARPLGICLYDRDKTYSVFISGDIAYVVAGDLLTIDISDSERPNELGLIRNVGRAKIHVEDNMLYMARSDLKIFDVSNPSRPNQVGQCEAPGAIDIAVSENYAYIIGFDDDFYIIDISDPINPEVVNTNHDLEYLISVYVSGNYCFIANEIGILYIFNISDPSEPSLVGSHIIEDYEITDISVGADYAYLVGYYWPSFSTLLKIIDISEPDNTEEVGNFELDDLASAVFIYESYAYIAEWQGIRIVDICDPENPIEVGYNISRSGIANDVFVFHNLIYLADEKYVGIYHFTHPEFIGNGSFNQTLNEFLIFPAYPNPFNSATTITYGLPYQSQVSLQIYNPLGQRINTLYEGYQYPGIHTTTLTANKLPSGLYFIRLETPGQSLSNKIMLVK